MEAIEFGGVEVDRCKSCEGLWFDVGESERLRDKDVATAIDTGDPLIGKQTNQIDRYRCPRCDGGMMRMTDPQHAHIWYEECTSCRGSFFDAGEFADLSMGAISEIIKRVSR
jgi:Zn-finger nucleic acid-binding protein